MIPQGENAWYVRAKSAERFTRAEVLASVDCVPDVAAGRFTFLSDDGATFSSDLTPLPPGVTPSWAASLSDAPLRQRHPDDPLAYTALPKLPRSTRTSAATIPFNRLPRP